MLNLAKTKQIYESLDFGSACEFTHVIPWWRDRWYLHTTRFPSLHTSVFTFGFV